jgi:hypothetical protein
MSNDCLERLWDRFIESNDDGNLFDSEIVEFVEQKDLRNMFSRDATLMFLSYVSGYKLGIQETVNKEAAE